MTEIIKAGTKVVFGAHAGMVGTDTMEFFILAQDMTDEELSKEAWEFGINHAEMYGVYPTDSMPEDMEEYDEDGGDSYNDNIEGWYEIYNAEEHDGHRVGGDTTFHSI